jgi:hypothetical protein
MSLVALGIGVILDIIEEALKHGTTKKAVISLIRDFADGKDGILGTSDDRLTTEQFVLLESMINSGIVDRLVENMYRSNLAHRLLKTIFPGCYA